jgi:hypothetical protein
MKNGARKTIILEVKKAKIGSQSAKTEFRAQKLSSGPKISIVV